MTEGDTDDVDEQVDAIVGATLVFVILLFFPYSN